MKQVRDLDLLGWLSFSVLHIVNASFHRMWGDELQAWALVLGSHDLPDLHMRLDRDGHPGLWYLALWPFKFITSSPVALQIVSATATISILWLLWKRSPFSRTEKLLLSFSFQLGYNLTVVCRSYVLGTLLIFVFATLWPRYKNHPWLAWSVLAVLVNVQLYFAAVSYSLALMWIHWADPDERPARGIPIFVLGMTYATSTALSGWNWFLRTKLPIVDIVPGLIVGLILWLLATHRLSHQVRTRLAIFISVAGLAALYQLLGYINSYNNKTPASLGRVISDLARGVVTVVNPTQPDYWHLGIADSAGLFLGLIMVTSVGLYFRHEPFLLFLLVLPVGFMITVFRLLFAGKLWHSGILFVTILGFVWVARRVNLKLGPHWLLLVIFVPQALVGANAMVRSKFNPISGCYATAEWIREQGLDTELLMGYRVFPTMGVAVYLEDEFYFPEARKKVVYSNWRQFINPKKAVNRILHRMREKGWNRAYLITPSERKEAIAREFDERKKLRYRVVFESSGSLRDEFTIFELWRPTRSSDPVPSER